MVSGVGQGTEKALEVTTVLASIYWQDGRWEEAEKLQLEVLERRKTVLGMEHLDTIIAAVIYRRVINHKADGVKQRGCCWNCWSNRRGFWVWSTRI
jgi:hypothetical protein